MKQTKKLSLRMDSPSRHDAAGLRISRWMAADVGLVDFGHAMEDVEIDSDDDTAVIEDETLFDLDTDPSVGSRRNRNKNGLVLKGKTGDAKETGKLCEFGGVWFQGGTGFGSSVFGGTSAFEDELLRSVIAGRLRL